MIPVQRKAETEPEMGEDSVGVLEVCMAMSAHRVQHVARRPRRSASLALVGLAGTLLLALVPIATGVTTSSATTSPKPGGKTTFTVGIKESVDSLNPFTGINASSYELYQINYDQLTNYGQKDFSTQPGLAKTWDVSTDGLTWTYHIRSGLKWSDGVPLTARDVAYTFNRIRNGKYEQTNFGNYVEAITSVVATDDQTVVMKVKKPTPIMLHLVVYILPEHIWKDIDEKEVKSYTNNPGPDGIVGSGPFIIKESKKGQFVRLQANKQYWAGAPHVDELVFRSFSNDDSLAQALRRGEIDFADDLGANVYNSLQKAPGVKTVPAQYSGFDEVAMNTGAALDDGTPIGNGHPALKDKRVRVAIAHAIDTKTLVSRVLGGHGTAATSIIPPLYDKLHYDPGSSAYTFDLAEANRLLDAAGYKKGAGGIRTMPDGSKPLKFRLFGRSDSPSSQRTVEFVTGWLKEIGIEAKPKIVSSDALTEIIGQGNFDMFEWGWVVEPDPNYQLSTFTCANRSYKDGGSVYANLSDSFYCNKAYDALYQKQSEQIDPVQRAETVKTMQKMLYDDAPYAMTYYYDDLQAYRSDRFTNFKPQPAPDGSLMFYYGTYSYTSLRPVSAEKKAAAKKNDSSNSGIVVASVVGGAVVIGGAVFFGLSRRRRPESEVE
jgi:peptide/nickel transport system substrate-binding protein